MRVPMKEQAIDTLKALDIPVGAVIDVGVQDCTRELMRAFPDKHHYLIEPISEWHAVIGRTYDKAGIAHTLLPIAAGDCAGEVTLETRSFNPNVAVTHANIVDDPSEGHDMRRVQGDRLDNLLRNDAFKSAPFLLKIDVDGAEGRILNGASELLRHCSIVVIEVLPHNMLERTHMLADAGFSVFDVSDLCYYDRRLAQFDMTFVSEAHLPKKAVNWTEFEAERWVRYLPSGS